MSNQGMFRGAKVLITGGAGFVGANMIEGLLLLGADVRATIHRKDAVVLDDRIDYVRCDLTNAEDCNEVVDGVDYVFMCAAHTSGAHEMATNPVAQITPNVFMNLLLLDAAAKNKVKKLLFISSSAIYPELDTPISEDKGFEGDPPGNYFGPGWMKRYTEKLAEFYFKWYGMGVTIIRPSNIYGSYSGFDLERAHVLPALIRRFLEKQDPLEVWGTPDVVRDFIYVDDFVRGALLAFEKLPGFDVCNIAAGELHTIGEAVDTIKELTGYTGTITYNSSKPMTIRQRKIDVSKAAEVLGFQTNISFREGLKRTIEWYESTLVK